MLIFFLIPFTSVLLFFIKDKDKERGRIMDVLILMNNLIYISPLLWAFVNSLPNGNMWNEGTGSGAVLWLYIIFLPVCLIAQVILLIFKLYFGYKSK